MKLLPRRNADNPAPPVTEVVDNPGGKGRPTPKRRDAAGVRGPVTAPKTRKQAYARQKQQAKASRVASRTPADSMTLQQRRTALKAGELLPKRDQGSTRKLARDWVDSHRMFSNYLLLLFPVMIVSFLIPQVQVVVIVVFAALVVEWFVVGRRLRRMALERFGTAQGGPMTIGFYAGSRAYLPRRWRLPAPQVQLGDDI